jgi:hypothetical protein
MQIQLKQPEIVEAIIGYLTNQGIDMSVKSVQIAFTAGRKGSGISAEVSIQESVMDSDTDFIEEDKEVAVAAPANLFN